MPLTLGPFPPDPPRSKAPILALVSFWPDQCHPSSLASSSSPRTAAGLCSQDTALLKPCSPLKAPGTPDAGDDDDDSDIVKNRVQACGLVLIWPRLPCLPCLLFPAVPLFWPLSGAFLHVSTARAHRFQRGQPGNHPPLPTCTAAAHRHSRHKLSAPEGGGGNPPRENLRRRRNDW